MGLRWPESVFLPEVFLITSLKPLEESSTLPFELMNEHQKYVSQIFESDNPSVGVPFIIHRRGWQEVNPCALFEAYGHTGAKASRGPLQSLRLHEIFFALLAFRRNHFSIKRMRPKQ